MTRSSLASVLTGRSSSRLIERYFLRELLVPTFLTFLLYTFLLLINQFFLLAEYAYRFDIPFARLGKLFLLQAPSVVVLTLPMSLLVGILLATGRLGSDSELIALSASGISLAALLRPVMRAAFALTLVTGWIAVDLLPRANHQFTHTILEIFQENLLRNIRPREFNSRLLPGLTFHIGGLERDKDGEDVWRNVLLDPYPQRAIERGRHEVIFAREARPAIDRSARALVLKLRGVTIHGSSAEGVRGYDVRTIAEYAKVFPPPPIVQGLFEGEGARSVREMTLLDLFEKLEMEAGETTGGASARILRLEIHKRLAIPFACVVFAFLGLGLGASTRRNSGRAFGFVVSLAVFLIYYQFFYAGERLAALGYITPWLSMWAGDIIFGLLGITLFALRASEAPRLRRAWSLFARGRPKWSWPGRPPRAAGSRRLARRLAFPSLLDRYIFTVYVGILALAVTFGVLLYIQVSLFQILDDIFRNNISVSIVARLYLAALPEILTYVLPISLLVATMVTFSLMTRSNEVTAMLVSGVSLYRVVRPVVVAGALVAGAFFAVYDRWLPHSNERYDELFKRVQGILPHPRVAAAQWAGGLDDRTFFHFDAYEPERGLFHRFSTYEFDPVAFAPTRHVFATRAHWRPAKLHLEAGWERIFRGDSTRFQAFAERDLPFAESRTDFAHEWRKPRHMNLAELRGYLAYRQARGLSAREIEIEIETRRAYPLLSLVMSILGLLFAFAIGKHGSLYGIGVAIVVAATYWGTVSVCAYLGKLGVLSPLTAAWAPNLVFSALGIAGFLNLRT